MRPLLDEPAAAPLAPRRPAVDRAASRPPAAPPHPAAGRAWWREALLVIGFYAAYTLIRDLHASHGGLRQATADAMDLIHLERAAGIFHEQWLQQTVIHDRAFIAACNSYYGTAHFLAVILVLVVLWVRYPHRYAVWRNTLAGTTALALVGFAFFPVIPPRLLPGGFHLVDTLRTMGGVWNFSDGVVAKASNQFAAMPSLHTAWSLWCAAAVIALTRRRWAWALAALYPLVTVWCVVVTGNHYFLDVAGGAVTLAAGAILARTGAILPRTGAILARAGAILPRAGALLPRAGAPRTANAAVRPVGITPGPGLPSFCMSSPTAAVPASLTEVATAVNHRIASALDADAARWSAIDADLEAPIAALRALVLAGGKRLRPAFCYWSFVGVGGDPEDPAIVDAGAALELLHTFALVHDDVMDASPRRHGQDTLHRQFAHRHRGAGWRGDSGRFGDGVAVLIGDLAHVYADLLIAGAPAPAIGVFNELRLEVTAGQYLDLLGTATRNTNPEVARRICQYKSGKYTVERPLHLGAALAAPWQLAELAEPLSRYGLPLGEAFQLKDDLLGCFGDPAVTGKPVGEDLREGKPTMLVALARAAASGAEQRLLDDGVGNAGLSDAQVSELQAVIEGTGARAQLEAIIDGLVDEALAATAALPLRAEAADALAELARFVAGRDH